MVRKSYQAQTRFDASPIANVALNFECRDEIVPILAGLKHIYTVSELRMKVVKLVAEDISQHSRRDVGRPGMNDWQVVVLAAIRLGCDYDYDKLQDQVENHRALRGVMGIGDWQDSEGFSFRRIRDTLCLIKPETISRINQVITTAGQAFDDEASKSIRADSFVIETNIHYPTESGLIWDGVRKFTPVCVELASHYDVAGWRQTQYLTRKIKKLKQSIGRLSASKSPRKKDVMESLYSDLITRTNLLLVRAKSLIETVKEDASRGAFDAKVIALEHWINLTEQVCDTARRRVLEGETVPNCEKLFSMFETHTQCYRRGKAGKPTQFGRLVLVYEDGAGFISHYQLLDRDACDADVVVEQTKIAQKKHRGEITTASFDRGFHSEENEKELKEVINEVCLLPRHPAQYAARLKEGSVSFHRTRLRHSGVEAAIGVMQRGNGAVRCRDKSELGFERYFGLAVLGRNIHTLGKLLIARRKADAAAAHCLRLAS